MASQQGFFFQAIEQKVNRFFSLLGTHAPNSDRESPGHVAAQKTKNFSRASLRSAQAVKGHGSRDKG
jgi:hypothetical protein